MGTSVLPFLYRFNGAVDTNQPVMQNLETMASAAGTWLTYDVTQGKWAVIINQPTAVTASFDDSNIIGGIQIGTTSLTELYNAVKVTFPRGDLNDQRDFVRAEIPGIDRNANEPDNDLNIDYDILNDPVQAEYLGLLELGQNRLDQTISFVTDFTNMGLKAGDVVDLTSAQYGITNFPLRITSITEVDDDSGGIQLQIVGVKYDAAIYTPDLNRFERSNQNGLITLNGINQPGNVTTTLFEKDARPRILANTTVPGNVAIETMELWSSTDNVNFELVGNLPPPGGGTYTTGTTVSFDFDRAQTGNIYLKSRALNSSAAGPYSNTATLSFESVQVTDAIGNSTVALDGSGNILSLLLALPELLGALDGFLDGDQNGFSDVQSSFTVNIDVSDTISIAQCEAMSVTSDTNHVYDTANLDDRDNWIVTNVVVPAGWDQLEVIFKTPTCEYSYDFIDDTGTQRTLQIRAQPAFLVALYEGTSLATATLITDTTIDWNNNTQRISIPDPDAGTYWGVLKLLPTYNLDMYWPRSFSEPNEIWPYDFTVSGTGGVTSMQWTVRTI